MPDAKLTAKDKALQIIQDQPDDSTVDELIKELLVLRMIEQGLEDHLAGRTITHEDLKKEVETWFK